eukprot:758356-Hanusia_phi.AAC.1
MAWEAAGLAVTRMKRLAGQSVQPSPLQISILALAPVVLSQAMCTCYPPHHSTYALPLPHTKPSGICEEDYPT